MEPMHFGLAAFWAGGDDITRGVALILFFMSVASWYVIVTRLWRLLSQRKLARGAGAFWHATSLAEGLQRLSGERQQNPFRLLAEEGLAAVEHHRSNQADLHGQLTLSDWVVSCLKGAIDDATERMQEGLPILASIGSTAPFIGLFGTVWGIYHALMNISAAGQNSIDTVAGPVGEALIMTAFGLAVAIPAVLGYNSLTRGNRTIVNRLNRFAHDLHAYLVTGSRVAKIETAGKAPLSAVNT